MDKNIKALVICESPNKVHKINEYLQNAGYTNVTVIASAGHIINIKDNKRSYKNTGIHPDQDFKLDFAVMPDKTTLVDKLKALTKTVDFVYIASDPDREGAQIAWSLIKFLSLKPKKYRRMVMHEITPKAVVDAFEHPVELETNLIEAAQARVAIDKLLGYALTPAAKTYLGAKSVGRCQSAGLKLVVDREKEILTFVPEVYYDLYLDFSKNNQKFRAKYVGTDAAPIQHLKDEVDIKVIKYKCSSDYIIKDIIKKERQESPKPPYCTATFQQEASAKTGLKVKDVMGIAQKLFERGFISYHRTDATNMSPEFLEELKAYTLTTYNTFNPPKQGKKTGNEQEGHECLRVTNPALTPELFKKQDVNNLHQKLYSLIWYRTIASVLDPARFSETTYNIYNNDQKFLLVSRELISSGFKTLYGAEADEKIDYVKENFTKGEILQKCKLSVEKKQTTPPTRYTEVSLVKKLTETDIGRPSTFATIIETILSPGRNYCNLIDKQIVPTSLGTQLSDFLDRAFPNLINLNYTKELESNLDLIAQGKLSKLDFLNSFFATLEKALKDNIIENAENGPNDGFKLCPKCGAPMVIRRSRFKTLFYGCSRYPECNGAISIK